MKNLSLILILMLCASISKATPPAIPTEKVKTLNVTQVEPSMQIEIDELLASHTLRIKNTAPITAIRLYNEHGLLVREIKEVNEIYDLDISRLIKGNYALAIQVHKGTTTHLFSID